MTLTQEGRIEDLERQVKTLKEDIRILEGLFAKEKKVVSIKSETDNTVIIGKGGEIDENGYHLLIKDYPASYITLDPGGFTRLKPGLNVLITASPLEIKAKT